MQRTALTTLAVALTTSFASSAFAQGGLDGVTMRVLDSVDDVDAVVIALDSRAGEEEGERAEAPRREREDADARGDERAPAEEADEPDERRADLLDEHEEERGEGQLEDRDVELEPEPEDPVEGETAPL